LIFNFISLFSQPTNDYKLVYSDEFNSSSISPEWNIEPYKEAGGITDECKASGHGYFTHPSNCSVANGLLTIKGSKLTHSIYQNPKNLKYEAGGISTGWFPKFGYFEIKCKMPSKQGFYPAFWFYNLSSTNWQEIDVFEYCAGKSFYEPSTHYERDNDNIHGNHHTANSKQIQVPDISADFHTYGVEWTPDWTHYYFDGSLRASFPTFNNQDPMIMLISLGVDVCFGGCTPDYNTVSSDGLQESQQFKVDYIRYYKKETFIEVLQKNRIFCTNTTENRISVTNYPNVSYEWKIPPQIQVIDSTNWDGSIYGARSKIISCSLPGTYSIEVIATFPNGYSQTAWFFVIFTGPQQSCSIGGTFNSSSTLSSVNFTSRTYNTVSLMGCPNVSKYEVNRINGYGGEVYAYCNTNCDYFSFDMNSSSGQSVTYRIKAFDQCGNLLGSKDVIFVKNQSGGYYGRSKTEQDNHLTFDNKIAEYEKDKIDVETETLLKNNTGIKNDKNNFSVFPNPSQYSINVMYPKKQVESVVINDILGKNCKTIKLGLDEIGFQDIDVSDMQNGVYIVTFYSDSKEILHRDKIYISR
jgi:beta-glucanase (GH16 family)